MKICFNRLFKTRIQEEWNKMTDQEKQAYKDSFRKKHKDQFVNVLGNLNFCL